MCIKAKPTSYIQHMTIKIVSLCHKYPFCNIQIFFPNLHHLFTIFPITKTRTMYNSSIYSIFFCLGSSFMWAFWGLSWSREPSCHLSFFLYNSFFLFGPVVVLLLLFLPSFLLSYLLPFAPFLGFFQLFCLFISPRSDFFM